MTQQEVKQLQPGLYRIYWRSDERTSMAAIGILKDGGRWLAPVMWSGPTIDQRIWEDIDRVKKL